MRPIQPNLGDIWIDGAWADLGDTQALACYRFGLELGEKYDMDAPINSSIVSFASLPEKEDQSMTLNLMVAVDAAGSALTTKYRQGDMIAVRYLIEGPIIEDTTPFSCQWDLMAVITGAGEITSAPNSNTATLPLTCQIASDGTNSLKLTLINDVAAY
jgi:hypothetical protein